MRSNTNIFVSVHDSFDDALTAIYKAARLDICKDDVRPFPTYRFSKDAAKLTFSFKTVVDWETIKSGYAAEVIKKTSEATVIIMFNEKVSTALISLTHGLIFC